MKTQKFTENDMKISLLEKTINNINDTLIRFEKRFDKIDERFDKVDEQFKVMDKKFDSKFDVINNRLWQLFFWSVASFGILLTVIAKAVHWFQ